MFTVFTLFQTLFRLKNEKVAKVQRLQDCFLYANCKRCEFFLIMSIKERHLYDFPEGSGSARKYMFTVWYHDRNVDVLDENQKVVETVLVKGLDFDVLWDNIKNLYELSEIEYGCLSQEVAPETGSLHGHLFLKFHDMISGVKLMKKLSIEGRQARFKEAFKPFACFEYCACVGHFAEGQPKGKPLPLRFEEIGERPKSEALSKKKDFSACLAMIEEGAELMEVCRAYPEIAIKGFSNLQKLYFLIREGKSKKKIDENIKNYELKKEFVPQNLIDENDVRDMFGVSLKKDFS